LQKSYRKGVLERFYRMARWSHLAEFRDAVAPTFEHSELTPALLHEWLATVTAEKFCGAALLALSSMGPGCVCLNLDSAIMMVKAAENGL
jgi:hypothetical protein